MTQLFEFLGRKRVIILIKILSEQEIMSFSELQRSLSGINSRILTERLDESVEKGYILRTVSIYKPLKIRYSLTNPGKRLGLKISELAKFAKTL